MLSARRLRRRFQEPLSRLYDHVLNSLRGKDWRSVRAVMIASSGRTGTHFLAKALHQPTLSMYAVHEPTPDLFDLGVEKYRSRLSSSVMAARIRHSRSSLLRNALASSAEYYIEANPYLSMMLPDLEHAFPWVRVIGVTRDLPAYLVSAYNKSPDRSGVMFFYGENDHRDRLTPKDVGDLAWTEKWDRCERLEKIAWWWGWCNAQLLDLKLRRGIPILKYESLFSPSSAGFSLLLQHMGLDDARCHAVSALRDGILADKADSSPRVLLEDLSGVDEDLVERLMQEYHHTRAALGYI